MPSTRHTSIAITMNASANSVRRVFSSNYKQSAPCGREISAFVITFKTHVTKRAMMKKNTLQNLIISVSSRATHLYTKQLHVFNWWEREFLAPQIDLTAAAPRSTVWLETNTTIYNEQRRWCWVGGFFSANLWVFVSEESVQYSRARCELKYDGRTRSAQTRN